MVKVKPIIGNLTTCADICLKYRGKSANIVEKIDIIRK